MTEATGRGRTTPDPISKVTSELAVVRSEVGDLQDSVRRMEMAGPLILLVIGAFVPITGFDTDDGTVTRALFPSIGWFLDHDEGSAADDAPFGYALTTWSLIALAVALVITILACSALGVSSPSRGSLRVLVISTIAVLIFLAGVVFGLWGMSAEVDTAGLQIATVVIAAGAIWVLVSVRQAYLRT